MLKNIQIKMFYFTRLFTVFVIISLRWQLSALCHPIISSICRKHPKQISLSSKQQLLMQGDRMAGSCSMYSWLLMGVFSFSMFRINWASLLQILRINFAKNREKIKPIK